VHHSQEELSILTTFRAHPLVHVSFLVAAIPVLTIGSNAVTPAVVFTVYACLGALPHANVRWSYGKAGAVLISPAYHRIHHAATGRRHQHGHDLHDLGRALAPRGVSCRG
jgi:sterol desaturase/sphingolipid hydroxylase (fatty acid hydroxylase superfamily)